jgi:ketosteroid isomerase-like protein
MAEHPNAEPIRRAFDAFASGDMATMQSLVAVNTVWHIPGRGPLAGDHSGRHLSFGPRQPARKHRLKANPTRAPDHGPWRSTHGGSWYNR